MCIFGNPRLFIYGPNTTHITMEHTNYKEIQRLVRSAVHRSKQHVYAEFEDVVQEAMLFILRNIQYFDPTKGKISTFVYMNVKRSLHNQTVYLNALKRKKAQFTMSLDKVLPTGTSAYELIADNTSVEDDVMFSTLMDSLTPMEQNIVTWWIHNRPWNEFQPKMKQEKLSRLRNQLKNKLKDVIRLSF
jgi:DNA-directed RNA polymerase specialized sigma subunit